MFCLGVVETPDTVWICFQIDSVQSLITCPGVLVCVGREAFSPLLVNFIRKSSEEKLPGLGPRTPGNGARSPATQGTRSSSHGASECSEGHESKKNGKLFIFTNVKKAQVFQYTLNQRSKIQVTFIFLFFPFS